MWTQFHKIFYFYVPKIDMKSRFLGFVPSYQYTLERCVQTTEDKFLHLCELFRFTLLCQVVPSAYSPSIVAYNLMWKLSLLWGLISERSIPTDDRSVTLLRFILCYHNRSVVIHCRYAIVVPIFPYIVPIVYLSPCISRITYFKPLYPE